MEVFRAMGADGRCILQHEWVADSLPKVVSSVCGVPLSL